MEVQTRHDAAQSVAPDATTAPHPEVPNITGGMIQLSICDNGQGMALVTAKPGHWGVRGMQERARLIGGQLNIYHRGRVVQL